MGVIIDTSVLIEIERRRLKSGGAAPVGPTAGTVLERVGLPDEPAALAAITASELLHGVHRAGPAQLARREAYVEAILDVFPVVPFDLLVARSHARIWANMSASGIEMGAHDRLVAATALSLGWSVATANVRHFAPVPGLAVVAVA